jgi:hypothetical protein
MSLSDVMKIAGVAVLIIGLGIVAFWLVIWMINGDEFLGSGGDQ